VLTGKAAKKAIKAMEKEKENESKYMSDRSHASYSRDPHRPDSAHRYSENEEAVTMEIPMQDSLATGLQQTAGEVTLVGHFEFEFGLTFVGYYEWLA
jgi:hypothetical protein